MKLLKAKFFIVAVFGVFMFFLSNDFGLIDIEKTAIITALAIDVEQGEYLVNAQVAVPESDKNNSQNVKAQISGKGYTVGAAIKDLGDLSGWYPKLDFCNLIILGKEVAETGAIQVLDYFSKTLRIQDTAAVVQSEDKAKDLLTVSTPLDEIPAFALQKALLKNHGFNRDVAESNIKTFVEGYYSEGCSCVMPLVKIVKQESEGKGASGKESESSGGKKEGAVLFDPSSSSLFFKGVKVGELDDIETLTLNMLKNDFTLTTLEIGTNNVVNNNTNYLLTVKKCNSNISITANEKDLTVKIDVRLYCKISDQNSGESDLQYNKNQPLPSDVVSAATEKIKSDIESVIKKEKETGCDFLKLKEHMYRYHYGEYGKYKDDFLSVFNYDINVKVEGQK